MLEARGDRLRLLGRVRVEQSFRGRAGQVIVEDSPDHVRLRVRLLGLDAGQGGARGAADVRGLRGAAGADLRELLPARLEPVLLVRGADDAPVLGTPPGPAG